ncbi:transporter, putative [Ricinus communis]|uniref:Transporter, putative n=1 Tax=Ricinus communis TaxID=3988 RepID=B9T1Z2_RICCO|nr:transporter, putative [Ricinus communis]
MDHSLLTQKQMCQALVPNKEANWITFPFVTGTMVGLTLAGVGYLSNIIVHLIEEFNFERINAAQLSNVVIGGNNIFPLVGAIVADLSLYLPVSLLWINSMPDPVKIPICSTILILAYGICRLWRSRYPTMGTNQFNKPEHQNTFFNWFFFTLYSSSVIGATAIVFIEDVSWALGFGLCLAANFICLVISLHGNRLYRHDKPEGSPFTGLARVVVATINKRKVLLSTRREEYYYEKDAKGKGVAASVLTKSFKFFNRAAMQTEGDIKPDGSIAKPWRICSVQQVEDFKTLIRTFPIWSSNIFVATPIAVQASLTVLQALAMDLHLGQHFQIPAGSISVLVLINNSISVPLTDRIFCPFWQMLRQKSPTPFQIIGVGHMLMC